MSASLEAYRTVVVGGGFYGCCLALARRAAHGGPVLLLEREEALLERASYHNQARVHQGYHYPRSFLTAIRSSANVPRFVAQFSDCIDRDFSMYYAIPRRFSNVTAAQFQLFCERIGAPIEPAPEDVASLFDRHLVEGIFRVSEMAFDADRLRSLIEALLQESGVDVRCGVEATRLEDAGSGALLVTTQRGTATEVYRSADVVCCLYSRLNTLLAASDFATVPLKHEVTELALIDPPPELRHIGVTVMCGPFFSVMPFPARRLHSLSHVRYTPHTSWHDTASEAHRDPYAVLDGYPRHSRFDEMIRDARRYLPILERATYRESLWEVKTVLPRNEADDGRPILMRTHYAHPALTCVLGSKLDNVYDAVDALVLEPAAHLS